jgi:ribose/xylose/arabinose/galactoside ABC-type transport system permease subunit
MGSPLLLNIVGAVVLGGTRLTGGRGSLLRTGIGVLFLGFLSNGMSLLGLQVTTSRSLPARSSSSRLPRTDCFVG